MDLTLIAVAVFLVAWDLAWWAAGIKPVSPRWPKRSLDPASEKLPLSVDVRTVFEYDLFHISGAVHNPGLLRNSVSLPTGDLGRPIVIVCMSGHRSPVAARLLKRKGFKDVSYLMWGMLSWVVTDGAITRGREER